MSWLSGVKTAIKLDNSCNSVTDLISCVHPQWLAQSILTPVSKEINQTLNIRCSDVNIGGKKHVQVPVLPAVKLWEIRSKLVFSAQI